MPCDFACERGLSSAAASAAASGEPEDQLRGPFENLVQQLAPLCGLKSVPVVTIGESSVEDLKTRPDCAVTVGGPLVGFIELKAPGKGGDPRRVKSGHDKAQWLRLLALPNLIYTDGNEFSHWHGGELATAVVRSVKELADVAARLCRPLGDEVVEALDRKTDALTTLAHDWRGLLFPQASDEQFADGCAQAVTFGLLMARGARHRGLHHCVRPFERPGVRAHAAGLAAASPRNLGHRLHARRSPARSRHAAVSGGTAGGVAARCARLGGLPKRSARAAPACIGRGVGDLPGATGLF